jgi:predicted DCC family thiol-disulfide oxidoreductase YuxK
MRLHALPLLQPLNENDQAFLALGPVYLFDGVCVLCSRAVRFTLANELESETPVRFVAIQSAIGRRLSLAYGNPPDKPYTFLFFENGGAYERTDAIIGLARHIGGKARMAPWLHAIPRPVRDFFYDRIARNRYSMFGKMDACIAPDATTRTRFMLPGD